MQIKYKTIERVSIHCTPDERNKVYEKFQMGWNWLSTTPIHANGDEVTMLYMVFERTVANTSAEEMLRRSK